MDIKPQKPPKEIKEKSSLQHKIWIGTFIICAAASLGIYFLLQLKQLDVIGSYRPALLRFSLAGAIIFAVLGVSEWLEKRIRTGDKTRAIRYNLLRVVKLLTIIVILLIIISFVYKNWYTAAVSLGLFSLILGFALQNPISSLIAWLYIVWRLPYKVGDRIEINNFAGDVVEIGYFDTTVWECGGPYLTPDLPTGRLIRFPNSLVLQTQVYNYSWKKFPYIWNEVPFHVSYESDLAFLQDEIKRIASECLGKEMEEDVEKLKEYLKETAVDELEIKDYPFVRLNINDNTWVEILLIYLVHPKKASMIKTKLIKEVLSSLAKKPDQVIFPKGNNR